MPTGPKKKAEKLTFQKKLALILGNGPDHVIPNQPPAMGIVPNPNHVLRMLARKKGMPSMKSQAQNLKRLNDSGKVKDPMVDWMSKPRLNPNK